MSENRWNWCSTCSEVRNHGTVCSMCGSPLRSRPSNNNINNDNGNNINGLPANLLELVMNSMQMSNQDVVNMDMNEMNLDTLGEMLSSVLNQNNIHIMNPPSTPVSKATSKAYLKEIPHIEITENSAILNEAILECTIVSYTFPKSSSTSSASSSSKEGTNPKKSTTKLQFDALTAEFGPSPPYDISGDLLSFLNCEDDMREPSSTTTEAKQKSPSNEKSKNPPKIAYMTRGKGVTFVQRAMYAQKMGAEALIIANHVPVWPYIMKDSKNALAKEKVPLSIPVVMIKKSDHYKLGKYFDKLQKLKENQKKDEKETISISFRIVAKSDDDRNTCIICRDQFEIGDKVMRLPSCFHTFHSECLLKWLENHNTCPTCRRELPLENPDAEINERRRLEQLFGGNPRRAFNSDSFYT